MTYLYIDVLYSVKVEFLGVVFTSASAQESERGVQSRTSTKRAKRLCASLQKSALFILFPHDIALFSLLPPPARGKLFPKGHFTRIVSQNVKILGRSLHSPRFKDVAFLELRCSVIFF